MEVARRSMRCGVYRLARALVAGMGALWALGTGLAPTAGMSALCASSAVASTLGEAPSLAREDPGPRDAPESGLELGVWHALEEGLEVGLFSAQRPPERGDGRIMILRAAPEPWRLEFAGLGEDSAATGRSARQWCEALGFAAAINAGMFATDYRTHLGYVRFRDHVVSAHVNAYQSLAAFDPREEGRPAFRIFDRDAPDTSLEAILRDYGSVVQNLRLLARPGRNRWSPQPKRWSEAALGEDGDGKILLILCRSPYSMYDLNEELRRLGVVAAQHLEGGPEAQMYIRAGGRELEWTGSHETLFEEADDVQRAWPVPNVLGLRGRSGPAQ